MICIIKDNDIYIRSKEWTEREDFVWKCNKVTTFGNNEYFNIDKAFICPTDCALEDLSAFQLFKESQDDICPVAFKGTDLGANHAYDCVDVVNCKCHGKTDSDIGSVWQDINGQKFCLVKIPDENSLWFVCFHEKNMADGKMSPGKPESSLSHIKGAVHAEAVVIESKRTTQLWRCFNHYSLRLMVDGQEYDITENKIIYGNRVSIITEYDVIYIPAMLRYLMEHAGQNTNVSQCSDEITEKYLRMLVTYHFNRNGSYTVHTDHLFARDMELSYIGVVQSIALEGDTYIYVPDTTYENMVKQELNDVRCIDRDSWKNPDKVPYRYYQLAVREGESIKASLGIRGMALVYDTSEDGDNKYRLNHMTHAGLYSNVKKMYPALVSDIEVKTDSRISATGAVMPLCFGDDFTTICWYWKENDIILMLDTHCALDREVTVPAYMNGLHVEILDKTENICFEQSQIINNKLKVATDGYGYLVLRLFE